MAGDEFGAGVPLGRTSSGTLRLRAGSQGLLFTADLDAENPLAQDYVNWGEPGLTPAERVFGWSSFTVLAYEDAL